MTIRPALFLLLVPLLLAGCAQRPPESDVDWRQYLPKEPPPPKPTQKPRSASRAPAPPAQTPAPEPAPAPAPTSFRAIGMSDAELRSKLGAPASEREIGPARVLEYRGRDCTVQLSLYYDTAREGFYALEQSVTGAAPTAEACFATMKGPGGA